MISQTGIFKAVRTTKSIKCIKCSWLPTGLLWKLLWYCSPRNFCRGIQYCTFLQRAFELLISENYTNFIVTLRCISVVIYCYSNIGFKRFYSLEMGMVEGNLKAHVFFSKYCPLIAKCIIFRVYTTVIYLKWEEYKLRILKIGWFLKTVWMKPQTLI